MGRGRRARDLSEHVSRTLGGQSCCRRWRAARRGDNLNCWRLGLRTVAGACHGQWSLATEDVALLAKRGERKARPWISQVVLCVVRDLPNDAVLIFPRNFVCVIFQDNYCFFAVVSQRKGSTEEMAEWCRGDGWTLSRGHQNIQESALQWRAARSPRRGQPSSFFFLFFHHRSHPGL